MITFRDKKTFCIVLLFSIALLNTVEAALNDTSEASNKEIAPMIIKTMLDNIHANGFNDCVHGLYINWDASGVNYNGTGVPDVNRCLWHDRLTDLRYLANLWRHKVIFKSNLYEADINKFTPVVLKEFQNVDPRGWIYNEFKDMAKLSGDIRYRTEMARILSNYAKAPSHPDRIDWVIEQGSALIQSGNHEYEVVGRNRIKKALSTYFSDRYNLVLWKTTEVKTSQQFDIAIALARAGYISEAQKLLTGIQPLWDRKYGGYYEGAIISG